VELEFIKKIKQTLNIEIIHLKDT